jgi:hypothetical protein
MPTAAHNLNDVAQAWHKPVIKFCALQTQKSLYALLIPLQSSSCLCSCSVKLHLLTCPCLRTQVHCDICWQLALLRFWMLLLCMVGHIHIMVLLAPYGTLVHYSLTKVLFSHMNILSYHGFPFSNKAGNIICCLFHIPHLMVLLTVLQDIITKNWFSL